MIFTQNAFPVLSMQNYKAYNRGDMYVPGSFVSAPLQAVSIATPWVGRRPIHSVPLSYQSIKPNMIGSRGMATPVKAVLPNGS